MDEPGLHGIQGAASQGNDVREATKASPIWLSGYVLQFVAIATTLVAAIVMGVAKETKTITVEITPTLAPLSIVATAKSTYSSACVYFIVANAIACTYSAFSLAMLIANRVTMKNLALLISIGDLIVVALLFSGNGAAAAIGVLGEKGNSHFGWHKVCNMYGKFCIQAIASGIASLLGSFAYVLLLLVVLISLHKRST